MRPGQRPPAWRGVVPALLLLFMLLLAGGAALRESAVVDEVAHIGAGVSYLQRLDLRLNGEHPPLAKVLAALPLVLGGVRADYGADIWARAADSRMAQWIFGEWVMNRWNDPAATVRWARLPMLLLTLALGWLVFALGRRLGGYWGGLLCLTVYATTGAFLAFGPLVLTDVPITFFTLLTLWAFAAVWLQPDTKSKGLFAAALAGALLSKFTAVLLFASFLGFGLSLLWRPVDSAGGSWTGQQVRWRSVAKGVLWALGAVYLVYLVLSWNQPTRDLDFLGEGAAGSFARRLVMPVWLYLRGVLLVFGGASRPVFLLGRSYPHGVWFYFPVLLLLKSSPGFLGLLALAGILSANGRKPVVPEAYRVHWRLLMIALAVFAGASFASPLNIGFRHFMVPLALLIVMLAPLPALLERFIERSPQMGRLAAACAAFCLVVCLGSAVRAYPYFIPYVNLFSFGRPAYELIGDSNLDWHQALPDVRAFAERHNLTSIRLDDYGMSDPTAIVPQALPWNCEQPSPGDAGQWAVVSANMLFDFRRCAWLTHGNLEPLGGGSMYALRLPDPIPPAPSPAVTPGYTPRALYREAVRHPDRTMRLLDELDAHTNLPKPGPVR